MGLQIDHYPDQGQIKLAGKFSSGYAFLFSSAYRRTLPDYVSKPLTIHLGDVDHVDTSALGALLLLHQDAAEQDTQIYLKGCKPTVRELLSIADFSKLFSFVD
ncbi:MAG TPA: STAS domain-containing protein [Rhodocyclaceae bacterium]|nr:STAS domain-containing protein [Rhodocyclaceae bacterium]